MVWFVLGVVAAIAIVGAAVRIVLGWVLPTPALAKIDHAVSSSLTLLFRFAVVGLAGVIGYVAWLAAG